MSGMGIGSLTRGSRRIKRAVWTQLRAAIVHLRTTALLLTELSAVRHGFVAGPDNALRRLSHSQIIAAGGEERRTHPEAAKLGGAESAHALTLHRAALVLAAGGLRRPLVKPG